MFLKARMSCDPAITERYSSPEGSRPQHKASPLISLSRIFMNCSFDRFPIVEGIVPETNYLDDKSLNRK